MGKDEAMQKRVRVFLVVRILAMAVSSGASAAPPPWWPDWLWWPGVGYVPITSSPRVVAGSVG
jgi:hypothetical protein